MCVACGVWRVACGVWRVACGVWRVWCVCLCLCESDVRMYMRVCVYMWMCVHFCVIIDKKHVNWVHLPLISLEMINQY